MTNKPKIYFLGSGPIAVPILKQVAASPVLELVGVGTQLDRPAGRSRRPTPTPVGAAAISLGLEPERIASVNSPEYLDGLRRRTPDIILVVSFGQILRAELLALPRVGCVNIHASLLPRYRGASPITQCILNRDAETGICFMAMERGLDSGPVYHSITVPLDYREYADILEFKLGRIAASVTPGILCAINAGHLEPRRQDSTLATVCTKIRKSDGMIDWRKNAYDIEAMIRAYFPWPGARMVLRTSRGEETVTLLRALVRRDQGGAPGQLLQADKYALVIGCGRWALEILGLAPPGRRAMPAVAYLNGLRGEKPEIVPFAPVSAPAENPI